MGRKRKHRKMICASCGEATPDNPCVHCGESPILDNRYVLQEVLGTGSEGTTYRARKLDVGRIVAVKEMPLRRAKDDKSRELLHREASILRQLDHRAIPSYLDDFSAGTGKNRAFYLVQEFIDGRPLSEEEQDHRYDVDEVLDILGELLDVLVYLHGLSPPVIHRDIKPSNVMRRKDGSLVIIDFGSVRDALADVQMGGETVTGTFGYMAPEQMMGDASEASDLYGLGALAVRLLSRREPHTLLRHDRTLDWQAHVQAPQRVLNLLESLLQPDPTVRARDAAQVRETIRWIADGSDEAGESTVPTFTPTGLALIAVFGIGLLGAVGYSLLASTDADTEDEARQPPSEGAVQAPTAPDDEPDPTVISTEITVGTDGLVVDTRYEVGTGTFPPRSGETDPDVVIVVFSNFVCNYCRRFSETLAQIDDVYGDRVAVYFRDYPLEIHLHAYDAHEAARCAHAQGHFWPMHDMLFAHQKELERHHLEGYASDLGLDPYAFRDCLRAGEIRLDIEIDRKAGREVGVDGTPTYVINGARYAGAFGVDRIREYVDLEIAHLEVERARGAQQEALDRLKEVGSGG